MATKRKTNPLKPGRNSKYHTHIEPYLDAIGAMMRNGATLEIIAEKFKVSVTSVKEYKQRFPAFAATMKENAEIADFTIEAALFNMAKTDKVAAFFWLKNRQARRWRDKQHVFQQNTNVQRFDYDNLSDEELERELKNMGDLTGEVSEEEPEVWPEAEGDEVH